VERQAIMANMAVNSNVVNFPVIIEIACVNSPTELLAVKQVYQSLYKHSLEEDIASHTTGDFRKVNFIHKLKELKTSNLCEFFKN
jgi:annexin D